MSHPGDIESRLRLLIEHGPALRAAGFATVMLPDGTSFSFHLAAPVPPAGIAAPSPEPDADDDDPIAEAQREERELRARWEAEWKRVTASSGARVPPFPGAEAARRGMQTLFGGRA